MILHVGIGWGESQAHHRQENLFSGSLDHMKASEEAEDLLSACTQASGSMDFSLVLGVSVWSQCHLKGFDWDVRDTLAPVLECELCPLNSTSVALALQMRWEQKPGGNLGNYMQ